MKALYPLDDAAACFVRLVAIDLPRAAPPAGGWACGSSALMSRDASGSIQAFARPTYPVHSGCSS